MQRYKKCWKEGWQILGVKKIQNTKYVEKEEEDDELACAGCGDAIYFMSGE